MKEFPLFSRNQHAVVLLVILFLVNGCGPQISPEQQVIDVRKVLAKRAQAIETKDIGLYRSLFVPDYRDGNNSLKEIVADMENRFARLSKISVSYQKAPVELKMNTARVIQRVVYQVEGMEKPVHDHETLYLRNVNGQWLISGGITVGLF